MRRFARRTLGLWWLRFGTCPVCNSSPPDPACPVCEGSREYGPALTPEREAEWCARFDAWLTIGRTD